VTLVTLSYQQVVGSNLTRGSKREAPEETSPLGEAQIVAIVANAIYENE